MLLIKNKTKHNKTKGIRCVKIHVVYKTENIGCVQITEAL